MGKQVRSKDFSPYFLNTLARTAEASHRNLRFGVEMNARQN
jgi:hypothetical protein